MPAAGVGSGLGIEIPEGDPGALEDAAADLRGVAGQLDRFSARLESGAAVDGWSGLAAFSFEGRCVQEAGVVTSGAAAADNAARALLNLAEELRKAQRVARRALEDAEAAERRRARAEADELSERESASAARDAAAGHALVASQREAAGAPAHAERIASEDAARAADGADDQAAQSRRVRVAAEAELDDERRRAASAGHDYEQAAGDAAQVLAALASLAPQVTAIHGVPITGWGQDPTAPGLPLPLTTRPAPEKREEDEGEHGVGGFLGGLAKGAWEGVKGIGSAGAMAVRSTPITAIVDRDAFDEQWDQNAAIASSAYQHPGEFGKAMVNWDDLSHGRYGEWLGGFGPDAVAAVATGGASAALTRSAAVTRRVGEFASSERALERVQRIHSALRGKLFEKKASAGDELGDPTLSGWVQPKPAGYDHVSPHDVRDYSEKIGHQLRPVGGPDHVRSPDGLPGQYNASHAEKQAALAHPGRPIAVTKPMCEDCKPFFVKHAEHTGSPQIVKDPETLRVFLPDGSVPESPLPSATVHVPAIDAKAAVAGGVAAHGAARLPEWAEGNL